MVDLCKHTVCQGTRIQPFLSIWHVHGDLYKHLWIDLSTDPDYRYSIGVE